MSAADPKHDDLYLIRHSLAHIMAQAVLELRPGSKLGFGPPIDDGFYYDFILSEPLGEEDFKDIEKRMNKIIKENQPFEMEDLDADAALARLDGMGEPYKKEYCQEKLIDELGNTSIRFYRNGPFLDMCQGPHLESTRKVPKACFKIRSIAGAYWRGDSRNVNMTRIYAWAFESGEALKAHVKAYREAQKRDHKKLGKELDLFSISDDIGKGLPLWHPKGYVLREQLEKFMEELEFKADYQRVATPNLAKTSLYRTTGHLPYYKEGMFPFMQMKEDSEDGESVTEEYVLKPMNCPGHHLIYKSSPRSYRDLPMRLAEYGHCHRYEKAGSLSGLLRVRAMCMNDAHIYCTEEQIKDEFLAVMNMHAELYDTLGIKNYHMRLSCWDPADPKGKEKYVDNPEAWDRTEALVREAMEESGLPFVEVKGEAAFYGPKIDFQFKTVTGREETASTNQLDFAIPARMDLFYTDSNNEDVHPYIIHRAPAGTHERFVAFLIEHFGGAFPTWLAPVQVQVIAVGEKFNGYANTVRDTLRSEYIRTDIDDGNDTMGKKVRTAIKQKIPNLAIVGAEEESAGTVTWRKYGHEEQQTLPLADFQAALLTSIRSRDIEGRPF